MAANTVVPKLFSSRPQGPPARLGSGLKLLLLSLAQADGGSLSTSSEVTSGVWYSSPLCLY